MRDVFSHLPIETIPLVMNIFILGYYVYRVDWWRILYWGGATILTMGLLLSHFQGARS